MSNQNTLFSHSHLSCTYAWKYICQLLTTPLSHFPQVLERRSDRRTSLCRERPPQRWGGCLSPESSPWHSNGPTDSWAEGESAEGNHACGKSRAVGHLLSGRQQYLLLWSVHVLRAAESCLRTKRHYGRRSHHVAANEHALWAACQPLAKEL